MARHTNEFQTIRSEGGLLPPDLLRRVLDPKENLPGSVAEDYGLPKGERINEVITQSWNRLRKHWTEFRAAAENLSENEPATGLTNDKWNLPLLRELTFGLLPTSAGPDVGGRTYAINRFSGPVPIHLIGCGLSLDRRAVGVRGAAAINPHGLVQEFLNRSPGHVWAIVSNGLRFRILRDNQTLSRQSFLEFDLEAMFAGEVYSDFVLLWLMAHATRFAPREGDRPETCWLEQWTKLADEQGTRALGELRGGVERALQILGEGFTSHPKNTALRDAVRTEQLSLTEFHGQLLRIVYRLIFLFVVEDRTLDGQPLLHPRDDSDAARIARERYAAHYSTDRLREMAGKIKGSRHGDLWRQFQILVHALSGDTSFAAVRDHLALPALGSFLWDPATTSALNNAELTNHDFLEALRDLAFTRQGRVLRPVDYKNLGAEELGGVYESLLSLTPQISADGARFTFAKFAGNERKTSGSYYTPDSLVQCLLDSALDPVVVEAVKSKTGAEAEKAILSLKVCDPAVGSGHFLVGAAHRLARHLSRVRALVQGESEPSPLLYQHALRDVIGRCLYGVDMSPMAAELCRVSLWLEALEPGKPLSFLDRHILVGNSLLGTTPELIAAGLPDDAFNGIEGDDKKICSALKKRNKQERESGQQDMLHLMVAEREEEYNSIESRVRAIDETPDDTIEAVQEKAQQFGSLVVSPDYQHAQQVADAWCAAFVWKKQTGAPEPITTDTIRRLASDPTALTVAQVTEVERVSCQYQFFHWHLAFPEVFANGGFDCVLSNPPWEVLEEEEKKFFALNRPDIADASTAIRKTLIDGLRNEDANLWIKWQEFNDERTRFKAFHRWSGLYPLSSYKKLNTYASFLERAFQLCANAGRLGLIVQSGLATDESRRFLFEKLTETGCLRSFLDFENSELLFTDVHPQQKFALVTVAGTPSTAPILFSFSNTRLEHLLEMDRQLLFVSEDLKRISPNTGSCPTFQSKRDAVITAKIYRHAPAFQNLSNGMGWKCEVVQMFNISSDNDDMERLQPPESHGVPTEVVAGRSREGYLPLYEGKFIGQLDHRYSTFHEQTVDEINHGIERIVSISEKHDPCLPVVPRWWMPRELVRSRLADLNYTREWIAGFCDVANPENQRTAFASIFPGVAAAHTIWMFYEIDDVRSAAFLVASINSFLFDFVVRRRIGSRHLAKFVFQQLPIIEERQLEQQISWDAGKRINDWVLPRVLELSYTAWDLEAFAQACGWAGPPFVWEEVRRYRLLCELDAAFFHLYLPAEKSGEWRPAEGETAENLARLKQSFPTPRDAVAYIMDTFPSIRSEDEKKYNGDYRTKRAILEIYDAMQESIRTGQPYQTRLDPPPADPACQHPKLKLGILAYGSLITDSGPEIAPKIKFRLKTMTPFPVEYGRYSGKTRGGAPTLVPHEAGAPVNAEIFVLDDSVTISEARDMLWRRERRREAAGETYVEGNSADSVLVREFNDSPWVRTVLYTDFRPEGKIPKPEAERLAKRAIQSIQEADEGKDGITYLMANLAAAIETPLTGAYKTQILECTQTELLEEALTKVKSNGD